MLQTKSQAVVKSGQIDWEEWLATRLGGENGTQSSYSLRPASLKLGVVLRGCGQGEGRVSGTIEVHQTAKDCRSATICSPSFPSCSSESLKNTFSLCQSNSLSGSGMETASNSQLPKR